MNTQILKTRILEFIKDEEGLTTVEYAIAGSLVGLAVVTAFTNLGEVVGNAIEGLESAVCSGSSVACGTN